MIEEIIDTDYLLGNLKHGIELVVSGEEKEVGLNSLVTKSVSEILKHGLREPKVSYWHVVRDLTHSSTRKSLARSLKHVDDNQQRGLFWIYYTLIEGSLDSYMQYLVTDKTLVVKHYTDLALIRDNFCATKFVLLLTSLTQVTITPLDSTVIVGLRLELQESSCSTLSSPGDSGLHESMDESFSSTSIEDCKSGLIDAKVKRRKRVSFHETVTGEGPKLTVWERRSADVETMAWWKAGLNDEKGEEALDLEMERGVPEGSEDPQPIEKKVTNVVKRRLKFSTEKQKDNQLMKIYPGPWKIDKNIQEYEELKYPVNKKEEFTNLKNLLKVNIYKKFEIVDSNGTAYLAVLTENDLCLLTLIKNHLKIHTYPYKEMKFISVGPSSEHITLQDGSKFLVTTRGEEFCSWLHYAIVKKLNRWLDFFRITPTDTFKSMMAKSNIDIDDIIYNSWVLSCNPMISSDFEVHDYLMFSFGLNSGVWEPALVEVTAKGELEIRPCSKGCRNLILPLSECYYCCRASGGRPHTFRLRFEKKMPKDRLDLYLAAPDEASMTSWVESIIFAVGSLKANKAEKDFGHYLIASESNLALINHQKKIVVRKTTIENITKIFIGETYAILELGCHEVEDKADDWILYFYSNELKTRFISFIVNLKPQLEKKILNHKEASCHWKLFEDENKKFSSDFKDLSSHLSCL